MFMVHLFIEGCGANWIPCIGKYTLLTFYFLYSKELFIHPPRFHYPHPPLRYYSCQWR